MGKQHIESRNPSPDVSASRNAGPPDFGEVLNAVMIAAAVYPVALIILVNLFVLNLQFAAASLCILVFLVPIGIVIGLLGGLISFILICIFQEYWFRRTSEHTAVAICGGFTGYWTTAWPFLFDIGNAPIHATLRLFLAGPVLAMLVGTIVTVSCVPRLRLDSNIAYQLGQFDLRSLFAFTLLAAIFLAIQRFMPGTINLTVLTLLYILSQWLTIVCIRYLRIGRKQ